jgi:hypothetical protein
MHKTPGKIKDIARAAKPIQYFTKGQKAFLISIGTHLGDRAAENAVPRELLVRAPGSQ